MKRVKLLSIMLIFYVMFLFGMGNNNGNIHKFNPIDRNNDINLKSLGVNSYEQISSRNIESIALNLLDKLIEEDVNSFDLELSKSYCRKNRWIGLFTQYYKGIQVWGSSYGFTIEDNGGISKVGYNLYSDIEIDIEPTVSEKEAFNIALEDFAIISQSEKNKVFGKSEIIIYPTSYDYETNEYILTYSFDIESEELPIKYRYFIDASSAKIIYKALLGNSATVYGDVKMLYYPEDQNDDPELSIYPFSGTDVEIIDLLGSSYGSTTTNTSGHYTVDISGSSGGYKLILTPDSEPENSFVKIIDYNNTLDNWSVPFGYYQSNKEVNGHHLSNETNAFHHLNEIHKYFQIEHDYTGMDYQVEAIVNCNFDNAIAWDDYLEFGKTAINKFALSSDVIYHEYTHLVVYSIYGNYINIICPTYVHPIQAKALNEAVADYFSCSINGDPINAETISNGGRNLDNTYTYDYVRWTLRWNDEHECSLPLSGALWDLRSVLGQSATDEIVFEALTMSPHPYTFIDMLDNCLIAADDDGIIYNGTPNQTTIINAFLNNHGIFGNYYAGNLNISIDTWYSDVYLIDDLNIASGCTLNVRTFYNGPGGSIYLNGHNISCSGTGYIINNGNLESDAFIIKDASSNIKGIYSDISVALQNYSTGQKIEVYGSPTMDSELTLSSSINLEILEGATLNLGAPLLLDGGTLTINSGASISPDIRLMNGTTVTGYYPTISSAFAAGSVVEVHGEYTSLDHVEVASGKTLKPQLGSELKFASGKYLGVLSGGNLTANGATFTSTSGAWNGIKYYNGSFGSLTNCTISDALYGVRLNSSRTVSNCTLSNNTYGIYCNASYPNINGCNISSNTTSTNYGIYCYDASPKLTENHISTDRGIRNYDSSPNIGQNEITSSEVGVHCEHHSSPNMATLEGTDAFNYLHADEVIGGVLASDYSFPILGATECGGNYGHNIFEYNSYIIGLAGGGLNSSVYAPHNWWGTSQPAASMFDGSVTYLPCLASRPSCSPQTPSPENNLYDSRMMLSSTIPSEEASEDLTRYYNKQWDLAKKIEFIRYAYMLGEAKGVAGLCKDIISENPYKPEAFAALDMIYQISKNEKIKKDFDKDMFKSYLKTFEDSKSNQFLKADAMLLLAGLEKDVNLMDRVYKEHKNTYVGKYALHQKFMYCFHEAEDTVAARTVLNEMDEVYPDEAVTYESHILMGDEVMDPKEFYSQYHKKNSPESIQSMPTDISEILPEEYALNAAYPNPFNPSMTLEYALPTQSDVKCSIYNVSGSLVKEYNFSQNAGTYSIVWNASNVSSGIYLIRFTAEAEDGSESFVDYQKVTLLK